MRAVRGGAEERRWRVLTWLGEVLGPGRPWSEPPLPWSEVWTFVPADVVPMLAHRVPRADADVPPEVARELRGAARAASMRFLIERRTVRAVDDLLGAAGIPFVWLKGAAIRWQVYPEPSLRPMEDVDVWVSTRDVALARAAAEAAGYRIDRRVDLGDELAGIESARLVSSSSRGIPVEIHSAPESFRDLPEWLVQALWARAAPLEGTHGSVLAPADTLLHLCLHLSRHHRFALGVRPLLDIALAVETWGAAIAWRDWAEEVRAAGAAASIWLPLRLSRSLFGAQVPEEVLEALRPGPEADALLALAREQFADTRALPRALERLLSGGSATEGLPGGVGAALHLVRRVPQKLREYVIRVRAGQIPVRGWREVRRLARGRRRLSEGLRTEDEAARDG